jgi:von Willebrand factor type A domain
MSRALIVLSLLLFGCLKVELINQSVKKPSNIVVYFKVDTLSGEPVPGLTSKDFLIYEDGELVSTFESKQTILNPQIASSQNTLLLLDLSGSITEAGQLDELIRASTIFVDKVAKVQKVGIYSFDGSKDIKKIASFSNNPEAIKGELAALAGYQAKDPSTNLNGAIVQGISELDKEVEKAQEPLSFGTLVVFTDGKDRAKRVTSEDVDGALESTESEIFVVGLGGELDKRSLRNVGRSGVFFASNPKDLAEAFDDVAARIEAMTQRFYLLSYCSPARAGDRELTVQTNSGIRRGKAIYNFNADGFSPTCDPNAPPSFDIKRGDQGKK